MANLFGEEPHSAGGKVRSALPSNVHGDAVFAGSRQQYRPMLRRWIGESFPDRFIVFIGMNPSTATAEVSDPTITREWGFAQREGYDGMVKLNVADYRATFPKDLLEAGIAVCSPENIKIFHEIVPRADKVVICHGKLNKALLEAGGRVHRILRDSQWPVWCFGTNADGSPRHPLYLAASTPLIPWRPQ